MINRLDHGVFFLMKAVFDLQLSKLIGQWGIWFICQGESYEGNVHLITTISSYADLAYFWLHSPIASLSNYFLNENNKQKTYRIGDVFKKINSIEFFRDGIEPKWEDPNNQKGGRFIFQVSKTQPNKEQIYEQLAFFFLGQNFDRSETVNGFRFISSKVNNPSSYRIEIWVNFDENDIESITIFQNVLTDLFKELNLELKEKIQFKQMKSDAAREKEKEAKEKEAKEAKQKEAKEAGKEEKQTKEDGINEKDSKQKEVKPEAK